MKPCRCILIVVFLFVLLSVIPCGSYAGDKLDTSVSADFVSRYIWRGIMINDAPNIQPAFGLGYKGLELGLWGSHTLSKTNSGEDNYGLSHEIDIELGYSFQFSNEMGFAVKLIDYYFPNGGIKIGNFNNYDDPEGAGAHTLEAGLVFTGSESLPLSISGYVNFYNDEGNNTYFQVDYSTNVNNIGIELFAGIAGGSDKNQGYYGTEKMNAINLGFTATKTISITDKFSLPVFVSYINNPNVEISYLLFGFSL